MMCLGIAQRAQLGNLGASRAFGPTETWTAACGRGGGNQELAQTQVALTPTLEELIWASTEVHTSPNQPKL